MKRPVTLKKLKTDRPRVNSRVVVKVKRPASNTAITTRPVGSSR